MFITIHTAAGIFIGEHVGNPFLGFFLGLLSHFFIDFIPHGDEKLRGKIFYYVAAIDILIALSLFSTFCLLKTNLSNIEPIIWSVAGAVLPDFICAVAETTGSKLFKKLDRLHIIIHSLNQGLVSLGVGLLFQLSIFIFAITALLIK